MRRRFRRGSRSFSRRKPVNWISDYWEAYNVSLNTGDTMSMALAVINDVDAGGAVVSMKYTVKRVLCRLAICMQALEVEEDLHAPLSFGIPWLLGVADNEDLDFQNVKTSGLQSWLQSGRIIQCGVLGWTYDNLVAGAFDRSGKSWPQQRIEFDWKGGVRMKPDDVLYLCLQTAVNVSALPLNDGQVDTEMRMSIIGYTRTLIQKSGA